MFAAAEPDSDIGGLFLECPYRDLGAAVRHRLDQRLPPVFRELGWLGMRLWAAALLPDFERISPVEAMAGRVPGDLPVWVLAGGADRLAPADEAAGLVAAGRGTTVVFPGAGHLGLRAADEALWTRSWAAFLAAVRVRWRLDSPDY